MVNINPKNLYGDRLKKNDSISELMLAMHVLWWRGFYFHNAIVTEVDADSGTFVVVHFTGGMLEEGRRFWRFENDIFVQFGGGRFLPGVCV